jgi:hypothetical protein
MDSPEEPQVYDKKTKMLNAANKSQRRREFALREQSRAKEREEEIKRLAREQGKPLKRSSHHKAAAYLDRHIKYSKRLLRENILLVLEDAGVIDSLKMAVEEFNHNHPGMNAYWEVGLALVPEGETPVGLILWDEEEMAMRDKVLTKVNDHSDAVVKKPASRAVKVAFPTRGHPSLWKEAISYSVKEEVPDYGDFGPLEPVETVGWHPLVIAEQAEALPLERRLLLAMERANGKMFNDKILFVRELAGRAGITE